MIKQLIEPGNGSVKTPEVRVLFEGDYLGEGVTGLRGVLLSMGIYRGQALADVSGGDLSVEHETGNGSKTVVSLRVVLTSLELSQEKLGELTEKALEQLQRALEF